MTQKAKIEENKLLYPNRKYSASDLRDSVAFLEMFRYKKIRDKCNGFGLVILINPVKAEQTCGDIAPIKPFERSVNGNKEIKNKLYDYE